MGEENKNIKDVTFKDINGKPIKLVDARTLKGGISFSSTRPLLNGWKQINNKPLRVRKVIFNNPATIVMWNDDTKTIVKCQNNDTYNKEVGLAMCCAKKLLGNNYKYYEVFEKYCGKNKK